MNPPSLGSIVPPNCDRVVCRECGCDCDFVGDGVVNPLFVLDELAVPDFLFSEGIDLSSSRSVPASCPSRLKALIEVKNKIVIFK